jgi:hypothetical protein
MSLLDGGCSGTFLRETGTALGGLRHGAPLSEGGEVDVEFGSKP